VSAITLKPEKNVAPLQTALTRHVTCAFLRLSELYNLLLGRGSHQKWRAAELISEMRVSVSQCTTHRLPLGYVKDGAHHATRIHSGFSQNCRYPGALGQSDRCLGAATSAPYSCGLNPNGIVNYIATNGYNFLCDTTKRCYGNGNVYEAGSGQLYTYYAIGNAARRYTKSCPAGTTFKTDLCMCFIDI